MKHDPFSEFIYAGVLVLLTHFIPVVKRSIQLAWKTFSSADFDIVKVPGSEGIGVFERILYIYCLTSTHREFIGSVLLFKAFSNWLIVQKTESVTAGAAPAHGEQNIAAAATAMDERHLLLAKFYTYAIGNFMSLMFAIFFYELIHLWGMKVLPVIPLSPFYLS